MNISALKHIYFLGIGGIGMSALARFFNGQACDIHGYDLTPSPITKALQDEGMHIHFQESIEMIPSDTELVIYTPAIPDNNKELQYIKAKGFPLLKRAEVIGKLSQEYETIAIAGTHGKTSITALTAHLLHQAGIPITAFIGGICNNYNSNLILSSNPKLLVVEADEFDRSFLQIKANTAVISSMDADHLDIYEDHQDLEDGFLAFAKNLENDGLLLYHHSLEALKRLSLNQETYGIQSAQGIRAENIRVSKGHFIFDCVTEATSIANLKLSVPGYHYIDNTLASIGIALHYGLSEEQIRAGINSFMGIERRFEFLIKTEDFVFVDDYAHHPEEIKATVTAIKMLYPDRRITAVFQPHLYSRTRDFAGEFAASLEPMDQIILLDIYPAREEPIPGITSRSILNLIDNPNKKLLSSKQLIAELKRSQAEVLLFMGAGDIGLLSKQLLKQMKS